MAIARRQFLQHAAAVAGGTLALPGIAGPLARLCAAEPAAASDAPTDARPNFLTLSIGTYAMPGVPLEKALAAIADAGFDGVEIAVMPGYADPASLSTERRKEVARQLASSGLRLTALMEHLLPADDDAEHRRQLDRLARVMELAADWAQYGKPPLIQTVLGNGTWDARRNFYRDRLADWLNLATRRQAVLAIKPHRNGAMSQPSEAIWLIEQLGNSPRLRMVYDYSHYAFRDLPLEETVRTSLPYTAHVAVKDAVKQGDRVTFLLPGEQNTHYPKLLKLLYDGGYRGDICCEVSSLISRQQGYDPVAAAKTCYRNMAAAFAAASVPRP
jgi:sugar phosphate isomerase/epimerase